MAAVPPEPKQNRDITTLWEPFRKRVEKVMAALVAKGYHPMVVEARRSQERQRWLYGVHREYLFNRPVATWTLTSRHIPGKACDLCDKKTGYSDPKFFAALKKAALAEGLRDYRGGIDFDKDGGHIQWGG